MGCAEVITDNCQWQRSLCAQVRKGLKALLQRRHLKHVMANVV